MTKLLECLKNGPQIVNKLASHKPIWDMNIQCEKVIIERKPDIAIPSKMEKTSIIIDVTIPGDKRITDKEK